ncbi:DnaJ domain-containing protein [Ruegeria profundi]|uniref:J domain-containing protein n=1 Tax=Ruegeria profundi TaxID=1685378 RepID=A0A0X3U2K9_9RHOB|nr:DnaJ domain-containing protein [Ruegeria profundi]KUJ82325.1 hypothetical protein AVO44_03455 [Ruegeria profundi]
MPPFLTVVASAVGLAFLLWVLMNAARSILGSRAQRAMGFALIAIGVALITTRAFALAVPLVIMGVSLVLLRGSSLGQTSKTRTSKVRSARLEMTLDHQSGKIDGRILTGKHEGQLLSDLDLTELMYLHAAIGDDDETERLLEAYLDSAHPDWRSYTQEDKPPNLHPLSKEEAYQILGLNAGASAEEIREAYNRLIKRVHPDQGGSAALTAQITEARNILLGDQN